MSLAPDGTKNTTAGAPSVTPISPDPSHTITVAKQGSGKSDAPDDAGSAVARRAVLEVNGAKCAPQTTRIVADNDPAASANGRNVRLLPSSKGVQGFWQGRNQGNIPSGL